VLSSQGERLLQDDEVVGKIDRYATFLTSVTRVSLLESALEKGAVFPSTQTVTSRLEMPSPTVVDDWRERIGACNDKAVRELDACVASMTKQDGRQKKEAVSRRDE